VKRETAFDRIPAVVCVDVEPDPRDVDRARPEEPWHGFEVLRQVFSRFRRALAARTGTPAHFAWFIRMDPQVAEVYGSPTWALSTYRRFVDEARAQGDELGIHPHSFRWEESRRAWINDHGNQSWVEHCVRMSVAAFEDALGSRCVSSRLGDRLMNDATVRLLEELGVRFDLTLEPGKPEVAGLVAGEPSTGRLPDLTMIPRRPYRPSLHDFRLPDSNRESGLWMLPVTTRRLSPLLRHARRVFCRLSGLELLTDVVSLSLALRPVLFRDVLDGATTDGGMNPLVFVLRSDSAVNAREEGRLLANLAYLLTDRIAGRLVFVTPSEAAAMLELDVSPRQSPGIER
jgi:hypothetical protein